MKRYLTTILMTLVAMTTLHAVPDFSTSKRYHIVCRQFTAGCVVDGLTAGVSDTPLYYQNSSSDTDDSYWLFNEVQSGQYTIQNAKTKQFITYDGVYTGTGRRYVSMTSTADGTLSLWTFQSVGDGIYTIRNVANTDHLWDVRVNSFTVGTYSSLGNGAANQQFSLYDQNGNLVRERTVDQGFDVSSWFTATTDDLNGWQNNGFFLNTGAGGSHINGNASLVAPFIENWHETAQGPLADCSLQQTLTSLPAGNYRLQADALAVFQGNNNWWNQSPEAKGTGVTLFANDKTVNVSTDNNMPLRYTLDFTVGTDGQLTLGLQARNTNANWIALDNVVLSFLGTESELLAGEEAKLRAELAQLLSDEEVEQEMANVGRDFLSMEALRKSFANRPGKSPIERALSDLTIDGHTLVYDESNDVYLCPIPLERFGSVYPATINFTLREGWDRVIIGISTVKPGDTYNIPAIKAQKPLTLKVHNADNGTFLSANILFTSLPVVAIYGSFSNSYSDGFIRVYEPNVDHSELLNMKAKWRGGITNGNGKNKRNYHVKLKDQEGNKLEQKFFGLRNDNSWILESCQVDMSRIRNRIVTDLWNDYATPPYYIDQEPKAKSGTRGRFVELILNGEYRGIYCMTENMDRKQLKLKKYDEQTGEIHGQLWKSKDWSYAVFMGHDTNSGYYPATSPASFNNYSEMWDNYQVKYPDLEDLSPTDWQTLWDAVNFVCTASDTQFAREVEQRFDLPVVIDYYILLETILATDNHGKNMFFACYDKQVSPKITFAIWDLDATIGQRWSDDYFHSTLMRPDQDYTEYITNNEHGDYNIFRRLKATNAANFNLRVRERYRDLRQTHLATESILDRFRKQLAEFKTAGADTREANKWNGNSDIAGHSLDFDDELAYIEDWITRRMDYLDTERFRIDELTPSSIHATTAEPMFTLRTSGQQIIIHSTAATSVALRNVAGQTISVVSLKPGENVVGPLPSGIYLVGKQKIAVR